MVSFLSSIPLTLIGLIFALGLGVKTWHSIGVHKRAAKSHDSRSSLFNRTQKQEMAISVFVVLVSIFQISYEESEIVRSSTWALLCLSAISWPIAFFFGLKSKK
jgi:hypothetical protein